MVDIFEVQQFTLGQLAAAGLVGVMVGLVIAGIVVLIVGLVAKHVDRSSTDEVLTEGVGGWYIHDDKCYECTVLSVHSHNRLLVHLDNHVFRGGARAVMIDRDEFELSERSN